MSYVTLKSETVRSLANDAIARVRAQRDRYRAEFCDERRKQDWLERLLRCKPDTRTDDEIIANVRKHGGFHAIIDLWFESYGDETMAVAHRLLVLANAAPEVKVCGRDLDRVTP